MSVEELQLGPGPDDPRITLHPHLTVISGLGPDERAELIATIRGAAAGTHPQAGLAYRDELGRSVVVRAGSRGPEIEATQPDEAGAHLLPAITEADLPRVVVVDAEALGLVPRPPAPADHPDLDAARSELATIETEVAEAERHAAARADQAAELAALDDELVDVALRAPRRVYARAKVALDAVRTEAAAAIAPLEEMDRDAALVALGPRLETAAHRWHGALAEVDHLDRELAGSPVLTPTERAEAMHAPDGVDPAVLAALDDVMRLKGRAEELAAEVVALSAQGPTPPADPIVVLLAHQDQELLWATHATALAATEGLERAQLAVGGLGASAGAAALVQALDDAHDGLLVSRERAKRQLMAGAAVAAIAAIISISQVSSVPLVAGLGLVAALAMITLVLVFPQRTVRHAEEAEAHALANVSASSYHGFQLRRVEINDPAVRRRLSKATSDNQAALASWAEVAGATTLVEAATREGEVRAHALELARFQATTQALGSARRTLNDHVQPALDERRRALAAHCGAPLDADPVDAVNRLRQRVERGRQARLELRRDHARGRADEAGHQLAGVLDSMGVPAGELAGRVALGWEARDGAHQREQARAAARPAAQIAADLATLQAAEEAARCPGWEDVTADEAIEPDITALQSAREALAAALAAARAEAGDPGELARRRASAASHLDAVEARLTPPTPEVEIDPDHIRDRLLDHLASAASPHPGGTLGILDEAFVHAPVRSTWDLLDLLERVAASRVQVVYLTDSPYVTAWGRRKAPAGVAAMLDVGPPR